MTGDRRKKHVSVDRLTPYRKRQQRRRLRRAMKDSK
jgi:hypothetical protein